MVPHHLAFMNQAMGSCTDAGLERWLPDCVFVPSRVYHTYLITNCLSQNTEKLRCIFPLTKGKVTATCSKLKLLTLHV